MNDTMRLMDTRCSTRVFSDEPVTRDERDAVLHAAMRAPTAGNLMLYSVIEVEDQAIRDELVVLCDDQPFIAAAPWVLVFVADYQKWVDLFAAGDVAGLEGVEHRGAPGEGDLLLACADALIAAQNAVIAAESLGIGSCYIGDILENGERVAELLDLPPHTAPAAMLCFGRAAATRPPAPRYERNVVHRDRYRRADADELARTLAELGEMHAPHGFRPGIANIAQDVYRRKYTAGFTREMNRSAAFWIDRWKLAEKD